MASAERLFFALLPPPAIQAELGRLAAWAERRCGGRAVSAQNIHLTVLFLGDVPPGQVQAVRCAAAGLRVAPFEVTLDRIEYWPGPRLLCAVSSRPPTTAGALAEALRAALRGVVELAARPFVCHATLLRRVRRLSEVSMSPLAWPVRELYLLRSQRLDGDLRCLPVDAWSCA